MGNHSITFDTFKKRTQYKSALYELKKIIDESKKDSSFQPDLSSFYLIVQKGVNNERNLVKSLIEKDSSYPQGMNTKGLDEITNYLNGPLIS